MPDVRNQFNRSNFENTTFNYGGQIIPKVLGAIPVSPSTFIGRNESTTDIHQKLSQNNNLLLLVNGKGGIGKTTLASKYYFEYAEYYSHLIWLVSEKGIKEAIISLAFSLKINFSKGLSPSQQMNEVLRTILELKQPVLLIIDNANNIDDLDENFRLLRQLNHVHILITSRIDNYQNIDTYEVHHLDEKAANDLFKYHFKAFKPEEQSLLDEILIAVGYNTLVIELLAKNLNEFNNDFKAHYPLQKLLEDIQLKGVLNISKSTAINADYKLEGAKSEDIIRTMYDISPLSENEKCILSIFAVLPATSIPFGDLELFLPDLEGLDRTLLKLSQKGWVDYDKTFKSFKANPIISEIVREQNKERIAQDTSSLLDVLINKLNYEPGLGHIEGDFAEIKKVIRYAETFVNNFDHTSYHQYVLLDRLGNFYRTYGNLNQAMAFFAKGLTFIQALYKSHPTNTNIKHGLAISYGKLGDTYTSLGNLEQALKFFEEVIALFEELYESYPTNESFKHGLTITYSKLGETHSSLGNLKQALKFFEEDLRLTKELYENAPTSIRFKNDLAISYEKLGETHSSLGNLEQALTFFEEETKLFRELYKSHPTNVSIKNGLAVSFEKLGDTHGSLGNLEQALKFFEDRSRLGKELYESHPTNIGIKHGLAISYGKLGDTHTSLGNLEQALKFFEAYLELRKALYESHPKNVRYKNGLAISYGKLGVLYSDQLNNKQKGIEFLKNAQTILGELKDQYPKYAEFTRNYDWVVRKIEGEG